MGSRAHHHGQIWQMVCALRTANPKIMNQEDLAKGGNTKRESLHPDATKRQGTHLVAEWPRRRGCILCCTVLNVDQD